MKLGRILLIAIFFSCNNSKQETTTSVDSLVTPADTLQKSTSSEAYAEQPKRDTTAAVPAQVKPVKEPSGIYQTVLPFNDSARMEQIVQFHKNHTYRLQEKFRKDSIVVTEGSWTPSDGFIWLYKEQLAYGRYKWKGGVLNYFDPKYNKTYVMQKLPDIRDNRAWQNKKAEGIVLFGIGNEPFWSVEFNNKDTISFLLSEWKTPVKLKIAETKRAQDSTIYLAQNDSAQVRLISLPYFCNDGMSDHVYPNKIVVQYNKQTYRGCGVVYQ
ncbi:MAG TPA: hypothetical protein VFS22_08315 [Flavisolibacter sp.]|nr:hypothetical protein [Flavisolibacter sp.]